MELQKYDGSFDLTEDLLTRIELRLQPCIETLQNLGLDTTSQQVLKLLATALVIGKFSYCNETYFE